MKKRNILIVVIILMAVGFAVVTTNLIINGNVAVSNNANDYDIKFTKATLEGIENNNLIKESGKKIIYETKKLTTLGDTSELIYEITNNSSQYDAKVTIKCAAKGETTHKDLYEINTSNTPNIIKAKSSKSGSIKVSLSKETMEEIREEFECELTIDALERTIIGKKEYKEEILNGADPVISKDLIPVTLSSTGVVTYADVNEEWYRYENKNWANAIILNEDAKEYSVGEVIEENDIESYFVWIPKYKYKLWNVGTSEENIGRHSIEIEFGLEDTSDIEGETCTTPMISGESGNCNNGEYMTHPAFISMETTGLWVGKFEVGYRGAQSAEEAEVDINDSTKIIVKPNVYSWRNSTVSNIFKTAYNYKRNLDSHMMKNTEWGAVAYLSYSKYGIGKKININNNSSYKTGYSALPSTNQESYPGIYGDGDGYNQPYNTIVGYLASTTGNITGIYDMSGGVHEYVASHINGNVGQSGFTSIGNYDQKYFDIYSVASAETAYQYRILGDGTGEIGPFNNYGDGDGINRWHNSWYGGYSYFVDSTYPWFQRGGYYISGGLAGLLNFAASPGDIYTVISFRLVLT